MKWRFTLKYIDIDFEEILCTMAYNINKVAYVVVPASNGDVSHDEKTKLHSSSVSSFTPRLLQREKSWTVVDVSNLKSKKLQSQSTVDIHKINRKEDAINRVRKLSSKVVPVIDGLLPNPPPKLPKTGLRTADVTSKSSGSAKADTLKSPSMSTLASRSYSSFREEPLYQTEPKLPKRPNTAVGTASLRKMKDLHRSVPDVSEQISRPRTAMREQSVKSRLGTQEKVHRPKTAVDGNKTTKYRSWAEFFKQREMSKKGKVNTEQKVSLSLCNK